MNDTPSSPYCDAHFVGRISLSNPSVPVFYYAGSYMVSRFQGRSLQADFSDEGAWNEFGNQVGFVVDDGELKVGQLRKGEAHQIVEAAGTKMATRAWQLRTIS